MKDKEKAIDLVKIILDVVATENEGGIEFYFLGLTYNFTSEEELSTTLQHIERWLNIDCNLIDINMRLDDLEK